MNRLAALATFAGLALAGIAATATQGCNGTSPAPFDQDGGGPISTATLTVGFTGTGSGTVSVASDAVVADGAASATCTAKCTEVYPSTASVNLTATAASGSNFDGWDPATSDPTCPTVSMAANITCTATFSLQPDAGPGDDAGEDAGPVDSGSSDAGDGSDGAG